MTIRTATAADAGSLAAFAARTFTDTFAADNRPEDMQAYLARTYGVAQQGAELGDARVMTLLADGDGPLLAFAQLRWHPPPSCVSHAAPIELRRFYVDRPAHGTGLAQRLMSAVHDTARGAGASHLWLGVWERNARAIAFYKKCGFTDAGRQDFVLGSDRQTDLVMVASIADEAP